MDSLTASAPEIIPAPPPPPPESPVPAPAMPREAPLAMPVQSLRQFSRSERRAWADAIRARTPWRERLFVFGGALALTVYGEREMYGVVEVGVITPLEWALVGLFVLTFSWICVAFTQCVLGFAWLVFRAPRPDPLPRGLNVRTAIVMPIYNEDPARTIAAMQAIEDIEATGLGESFDDVVLSDTTNRRRLDPRGAGVLAMRERFPMARLWYRRRWRNVSRKAGNIADFVTRWGAAYDHMIVLDADSLMTGGCDRPARADDGSRSGRRHRAEPAADRQSQHFVRPRAAIRGARRRPRHRRRPDALVRRNGNYWGHNAIIRMRAFAEQCGMPELPGRQPFGGHILSHDFVEAALMRRAGWTVYMLPMSAAASRKAPPSLIDLAARDRRWCQGNLQHLRILAEQGFVLASREHLLIGIMGYLVLAALAGAADASASCSRCNRNTSGRSISMPTFSMFPAWPRFDCRTDAARCSGSPWSYCWSRRSSA